MSPERGQGRVTTGFCANMLLSLPACGAGQWDGVDRAGAGLSWEGTKARRDPFQVSLMSQPSMSHQPTLRGNSRCQARRTRHPSPTEPSTVAITAAQPPPQKEREGREAERPSRSTEVVGGQEPKLCLLSGHCLHAGTEAATSSVLLAVRARAGHSQCSGSCHPILATLALTPVSDPWPLAPGP